MAAARARWDHKNGLARFSALVDSAFHGTCSVDHKFRRKRKESKLPSLFYCCRVQQQGVMGLLCESRHRVYRPIFDSLVRRLPLADRSSRLWRSCFNVVWRCTVKKFPEHGTRDSHTCQSAKIADNKVAILGFTLAITTAAPGFDQCLTHCKTLKL